MKMTKYLKIKEFLFALLCCCPLLMFSCSSDDDEVQVIKGKGAETPLMQAIADNVPRIKSVEKDSSFTIAEGLKVTKVQMTFYNKISHMFIAEVDLLGKFRAVASTANNDPNANQLQTIPDQAQALEKAGSKVLFGINGDFYGLGANNTYFPMGEFVKDGIVIKDKASAPNEAVLCVMNDGIIKITDSEGFQKIKGNIRDAVGGWQRLINSGRVCEDFVISDNSMRFDPRTFAGVTQDGKKLYLFVVDGGQGRGMDDYSNGMRLEDQMLICQAVGCYDALNFDGGGSSTFMIRDQKSTSPKFIIMNKPSDGEPRAVFNGLMIIEK